MVNIWENPNKKVGNELKWPGGEMEAWESMAGAVELGDRGFEPGVRAKRFRSSLHLLLLWLSWPSLLLG